MPTSVIVLDFDPFLRLGDRAVRLETIALAGAILLGLIVAAIAGGRARLRRDDLLFVIVGAIPGGVIGGRLGYVLLHLDYYRVHPGAVFDPAAGGLELGLAVVFAIVAGIYVARLLEAPVARWLDLLAVPLLLTLGLGKLALVLGGDGQGSPSSDPWATAYAGGWNWDSLGPSIPSHPAQLYEAIATGVLVALLLSAVFLGGFAVRDGRLFFVALGGWAVARFVVAFWWRDPVVLGPLRAEQLISLALASLSFLAAALAPLLARREAAAQRARREPEVRWPDPETRPRF